LLSETPARRSGVRVVSLDGKKDMAANLTAIAASASRWLR